MSGNTEILPKTIQARVQRFAHDCLCRKQEAINANNIGAWIDTRTGKQYICDGSVLLELNTPVNDIVEIPTSVEVEKVAEMLEKERIKIRCQEMRNVAIPRVTALKKHMSEARKLCKVQNSHKRVLMRLCDSTGLCINAAHLVKMLGILGVATNTRLYIADNPQNHKQPVYIEGERGAAIILPVVKGKEDVRRQEKYFCG